MNSRPEIFLVATVLLVPFFYYATSIPDACALPPKRGPSDATCEVDPGSAGEKPKRTCCWFEPGTGPGLIKLREQYCQTCTPNASGEWVNCGDAELQVIGKPPAPEAGSGVLQDPSTESGPKLLQKDGMTFSLLNDTKTTPSEANNTSNNTLAHLQSEVENDTHEEGIGETGEEKEADESQESGDSNEEEEEDE